MCNLNSRVGEPVVKDVHCEKDRGGKHMMWNCHHPGTVGRCTAFAPMRTFIRASTSSSRPSSFVHVLVRSFVPWCAHALARFFSCVRSFILPMVYSCARSFSVRSLVRLFVRSFIRWCVRELVRFYVLLFVRWFIRAITRFLCIRSFLGALVCTLFYFSCRCSVARLLGGQRPLLVFFFLTWYEWFNHLLQALCFLHFFYSYARKASPTYEPYRRLVKVIDYSFSLLLKTLVKTQNRKKNLRCTLSSSYEVWQFWFFVCLYFFTFYYFCITSFCDWSRKLYHILNRLDSKLKPIATWE